MLDIPKDTLNKIDNMIKNEPLAEIEVSEKTSCCGCTGSCSSSCIGVCIGCCVGTCADGCTASCLVQLDLRAWFESEEKACKESDNRGS